MNPDASSPPRLWPILVPAIPASMVVAWMAQFGVRQFLLLLLGAGLGALLQAGRFGFTAGYRRLLTRGEVDGVQAQLVLVALLTLFSTPLLAGGTLFGHPTFGLTAPVSLQVAIGAFAFGIGMQLANGCGSGTLYALGAGSLRMAVTLVCFCLGAFLATLHWGWWQATLPPGHWLVLGELVGWWPAAAIQIAALTLLWFLLGRFGRRGASGGGQLPPVLAAIGLAVLAALVLAVAGQPWSVTWAFGLWAAKLAAAVGWDPATSSYWQEPGAAAALAQPIGRDIVSVLDLGVIIGAWLASAGAGAWRPRFDRSPRRLVAAALGGLVMGYGARLAYGCNIGSFLAGVASTSLHGWLWLAAGLAGNAIGVRLRLLGGLA